MLIPRSVQINETREQMRGGAGSAQLTHLSPVLPDKLRVFSKIVLRPGCSIGYHVHEHETELFYFIGGSGIADDDGTIKRISCGDVLITPDGTGHSIQNDGDEDLVFVAVIVKD